MSHQNILWRKHLKIKVAIKLVSEFCKDYRVSGLVYRQVDAHALYNILITSSRSNSGVLKNQEKISQFCAVNISFPTMGASFEQKNYWNWTLMHQDFLSVNIF